MRQSIAEFDVAGAVHTCGRLHVRLMRGDPSTAHPGRGYPEGENCMAALWLRLERVGIESGGIILDIELMKPIQLVEHKTRSKSCRIPVAEITVNPRGLAAKPSPRYKQSAIVFKIVYTYFEPVRC